MYSVNFIGFRVKFYHLCYRYRLTDSIDNKFMIYPNTGRIATRVKLDREEVSQYTLEVIAMDTSLLPLSSSTTVIVNVRDMNDNAPEFSSDSYTRDLHQPTGAGMILSLFFRLSVEWSLYII